MLKKIVSIITIVSFLFVLIACDGEKSTSSAPSAPGKTETESSIENEKPFQETQNTEEDVSFGAPDMPEDGLNASTGGFRWVLKSTGYTLNNPDNKEFHNIGYSYEGESDGFIRFIRTGGYYADDKHHAVCKGTYECETAPEIIPSGGTVQMDMKLTIEDYSFAASGDTLSSVHFGTLSLRGSNGTKFVNESNEDSLHVGTAAGIPYTSGNTHKEGTFTYTMPKTEDTGNTVGAEYSIEFSCEAGTYIWTYEIQQ